MFSKTNGINGARHGIKNTREHQGSESNCLQRQAAYAALFATELDDDVIAAIRGATAKGQVLGDDRFQDEVAAMTGKRTTPHSPGRKRKEVGKSFEGEQVGFGF